MVQTAISGKSGPQLTPGVEHHLADRVAVRAEPDDQRVQRGAVDDVATKISLPRDRLGVHGAAQRGKQIPPLGLPGRFGFEPARQSEWRDLLTALRRAVDTELILRE